MLTFGIRMTKVALITGSTSGIGLGIAKEFAAKGYNLMFNGLEKNGPEIAQDVAQQYGVKTKFNGANMMKPDEIAALVKDTEDTFGHIDVLINCAGVQFVSPIEDFPNERWDLIIGVNLSSAFHTTKAAWRGMKARRFGRIINISSAHGLVASKGKSAYVASKHGITGLTKAIALEGAEYNITCNAICPGYVRTPLVEGQIKDQAKLHGISEEEVISKIMLEQHAVKEFVSIESLAGMALFLASEEAKVITGASIPMEGGWTAK